MKKILIIALLGALCMPLWAQDDVRQLTAAAFRAQVFDYTKDSVWNYKGTKPCIIDFYADWCGPCRRLGPVLAELAEEHCDQIIFYKVNVDKEKELAYLFRASSIPLLVFVPKKGKPQSLMGYRPKSDLETIIQEFLLK